MVSKQEFDIISAFDALAKEKNYERMKSNPDEVCMVIHY